MTGVALVTTCKKSLLANKMRLPPMSGLQPDPAPPPRKMQVSLCNSESTMAGLAASRRSSVAKGRVRMALGWRHGVGLLEKHSRPSTASLFFGADIGGEAKAGGRTAFSDTSR